MTQRLEESTLQERQARQFRIFGSEQERRAAIQNAVDEYVGNVVTLSRQSIRAETLANLNLRDLMLMDTSPAEQKMIRQAVEAKTAKTFV